MNRRAFLRLPLLAPMLNLRGGSRLGRLVVFEGNSMSCLNNGTQPPSWTTLFLQGNTARALQLCGVNVSVAGDDIRHANQRAPIYVDPLLNAMGVGVCVLWEGTNSLSQNNYDAELTFYRHYQYCMKRKALGWRVILGTIANRRYVGNWVEDDGRHEAARLVFNQLARSNAGEFDGILDVGADEILGADHAAWDLTYFRDGVHLTAAGAARVAAIAEKVIPPLVTPLMIFPVVNR
jgi:lysophospholipase L1-like esterase